MDVSLIFEPNDSWADECIGEIGTTPQNPIARVYITEDGDYYSAINYSYMYYSPYVSSDEIKEHFGGKKYTEKDAIEYAVSLILSDLQSQVNAERRAK